MFRFFSGQKIDFCRIFNELSSTRGRKKDRKDLNFKKDRKTQKDLKMAEKLRPDELQAFKAAFDMFDKNGDGTISTKVNSSNNFYLNCTDDDEENLYGKCMLCLSQVCRSYLALLTSRSLLTVRLD